MSHRSDLGGLTKKKITLSSWNVQVQGLDWINEWKSSQCPKKNCERPSESPAEPAGFQLWPRSVAALQLSYITLLQKTSAPEAALRTGNNLFPSICHSGGVRMQECYDFSPSSQPSLLQYLYDCCVYILMTSRENYSVVQMLNMFVCFQWRWSIQVWLGLYTCGWNSFLFSALYFHDFQTLFYFTSDYMCVRV